MGKLIDEIKLPETLKQLSAKQLEQVASEVRSIILESTSRFGGHVAPSLGVVELSVAFHAAFNSPKDKIVWDVGHQAYAHKILTGRKGDFPTLRQFKGLSGFPNIEESPHDSFTVGHASTSISQAMGLVQARDVMCENHAVVAVIGDGSISGGLAFEGVNNAGSIKSNMIVVLNDNEMSISKNVGALSNYLTAFKTSNIYSDIRDRIDKIVDRIPRGKSLFESAMKLKDRTRHIVMSFKVDVIFEELGFKYFGPIDGHNIPLLISTLHHAREINGPVLIHILTKKGKGYKPAEVDPVKFHGTGPFDLLSGKSISSDNTIPSFTEVFGKTLSNMAEKDEKIVAVTAAMIDGTGLDDFSKKYPKRFFDVGICEEHAVTFSGGMARGGLKPFVAIYSTFLQRGYDQIMHDVALQNLPVVFAVDRGGIVGEDGATHNGIFDMAFLRTVPNMVVMAPKDERELQNMMFTASFAMQPVSIRYPRGKGFGVDISSDDYELLDIGKGEVVFESKNSKDIFDLCIFAVGSMVYPSVEAAKKLEKSGISVKVINARYIKPLDDELIISSAKNSKAVVTVEEGVESGGFGSAVLDLLSESKIKTPFLKIGIPCKFVEHGKRETILELLGLDEKGITKKISSWLGAL